MLVPGGIPFFTEGDAISADAFNRMLESLGQLANLHVYPPLVLEQSATGYHLCIDWNALSYLTGDLTIGSYLDIPIVPPASNADGLVFVLPGTCSFYWYCGGKLKTDPGLPVGGPGVVSGTFKSGDATPKTITVTNGWVTGIQ